MAIDKKSFESIARYLSGDISHTEKDSVEAWIRESEENRVLFEEIKKIWQSAGIRLNAGETDSGRLFSEIQNRINETPTRTAKIVSILKPYNFYLRVAAALCLFITSYFLVKWVAGENITIEADDTVATLYLPDSTKVWLNTNSQITYSRAFETREIHLQGEAFFSVQKDTSRFTVQTNHTLTQVLGTSFNLKEQIDSSVTLVVAEGTVKFSNAHSKDDESVTVRKDEKALFKPKTKLQKAENNDPAFAAWREENNPAFADEKANPVKYLTHNFSWRQNQIKQSVIEGTLKNNASLAAYRHVVLEATYIKPDGKSVTLDLVINQTVYPGKRISYTRRLLDILSDTRSLVVKIKSAETTTLKSY